MIQQNGAPMTSRSKRSASPAMWLLAAAAAVLPAVASVKAGAEDVPPASAVAGSLAPAQSALALRLVDKLAAKQSGTNIVVSPASLAGALAVIEKGGDRQLQSNLHDLLGFKKSPTAWVDFEALRRATGRTPGNGPLASANAIVFDAKTKPYPTAIDALSQSGIQASTADFAKPETLAAINDWVAKHTNGKIPTILDELPKNTGLVALNAVYFKDRWKQTFDAKETRSGPFHLLGGTAVDVPLMHASERRFHFRQDARFVAVDLPYATAGFSLVVVTTKNAPAAAADFAGLSEWLEGDGFAEAPGEIALPRFGATANVDLMPTLAALGFKTPNTLPGFASGPLRIAKVRQRVELKVDEEGTEAAAATAVTATRSTESNFVKMVADKPFVFALRDATTGLIVVAGYVAKPEATEPTTSNTADKPTPN
jgi:serine protease inhibitor